MKNDELLLDQYIASFERLDSLLDIETIGPVADELFTGERTDHGWKRWRPIKVRTELSICLQLLRVSAGHDRSSQTGLDEIRTEATRSADGASGCRLRNTRVAHTLRLVQCIR
ncbi:MAG: hypothetical protein ACYDA9_12385 [Terriglobia bacterium]